MTTLITALPHVFIPLTIIVAVTSFIGVLGNAMAFYVFHFRFPSTGFNKLMATLALYDVMACTVHMPLDIATFFPVGSARSYLCKITCFLLSFTSTGSALVLLAIAFVRYYGIHKPFLGLFSTKSALYVVVVSALTASGIGLPITFLFGSGDLNMDSNITAEICAVESRFSKTEGPIAYYIVLAGLYVVTLCLHTFLYIRSVVTVWNRRRMFTAVKVKGNKHTVVMTPTVAPRTQNRRPTKPIPAARGAKSTTNRQQQPESLRRYGDASNDDGVQYPSRARGNPSLDGQPQRSFELNATHDSAIEPKTHQDNKCNVNINQQRTKRQSDPSSSTEMTSYSNASTLPVRVPGTMVSRNGNNVNQTSYRVLAVVIAISIAYFLSYAPHFGVMFYLFTHDKEVFTESAQSLVFELLMRSFFLNNVLDPVIYGLLSADFRREARRSLSKLFCVCFRR